MEYILLTEGVNMNKKKRGKFNVPNAGGKRGKKRVKSRWRKPRGIDNKKRIRKKSHGKNVKIGYKNDAKRRNLHPSGKEEVRVFNVQEVESLKGRDVVVRIAGQVGKKKRIEIMKKAEELNLRVLNPVKDINKE